MTKDALAKQGINIPDLSKFTGGGGNDVDGLPNMGDGLRSRARALIR